MMLRSSTLRAALRRPDGRATDGLSHLPEAGAWRMDGRIGGLTAAALLTAGLALAGEVPTGAAPAPRAAPVLDVRQSMPEWVSPGEAVPIDVVIGNLGTAVAEGVTVRSTLAPSLD